MYYEWNSTPQCGGELAEGSNCRNGNFCFNPIDCVYNSNPALNTWCPNGTPCPTSGICEFNYRDYGFKQNCDELSEQQCKDMGQRDPNLKWCGKIPGPGPRPGPRPEKVRCRINEHHFPRTFLKHGCSSQTFSMDDYKDPDFVAAGVCGQYWEIPVWNDMNICDGQVEQHGNNWICTSGRNCSPM